MLRQKDHLNQMPIATNSEKLDISLEDRTSELAKKISISLNKADVVLFHGEIGVGKTTFIKHLINNLQKLNNINQTEITSPTFNLVNEYDWLAKPERQKLFKIIPFKRPSSSFGYSQAVKGTWEQYKNETGNKLATRARFKDSVDFIGWYTDKTESLLKISKQDAFRQYIAYHEGWGGYKNYKNNQKVIGLAKRVKNQSDKYKSQLRECQKRLNKNKYIIF